jgi:hypothetical protein
MKTLTPLHEIAFLCYLAMRGVVQTATKKYIVCFNISLGDN